jgi:hypothetical protein
MGSIEQTAKDRYRIITFSFNFKDTLNDGHFKGFGCLRQLPVVDNLCEDNNPFTFW